MRLISLLAAFALVFSPVAVGAVTISISDGTNTNSFSGQQTGTLGSIAYSITGKSEDNPILGFLETDIEISFTGSAGGFATVETIANYTQFSPILDSPFLNIGSRANVFDIWLTAPVFDPDRGSVLVQHFISFDGGAETELADFLFADRTGGDKREFDTIEREEKNYQLRSLFTFVAKEEGIAGLTGQIFVVDENTKPPVPPVPLPAGFLLMGTALVGFGVIRRKRIKET